MDYIVNDNYLQELAVHFFNEFPVFSKPRSAHKKTQSHLSENIQKMTPFP